MDLMKYRKYIADKILDDYNQNAIKTKQMDDGNYKPMRKCGNDTLCASKPPKIPRVPRAPQNSPVATVDDLEDIIGGKFNFSKTMKSVGKAISKDSKKAVTTVKDTAIKTGAQLAGKEAGTYIYNGLKVAGKTAMQYAPEVAEEAGMTVAENPELLMLAAGLKKPKVKRAQSQKQINRNKLVKQLMDKHGLSLPEASKYVKDHNLKY